jgi:phytoene dehydrogenase-like protein
MDIIIVGAGFAGTCAATLLREQLDARVTLLEGHEVPGGMLRTLYTKEGLSYEYGPRVVSVFRGTQEIIPFLRRFVSRGETDLPGNAPPTGISDHPFSRRSREPPSASLWGTDQTRAGQDRTGEVASRRGESPRLPRIDGRGHPNGARVRRLQREVLGSPARADARCLGQAPPT